MYSLLQIPSMAFAVAGIDATFRYQLDRHIWDVDPRLLSPNLQLAYVSVSYPVPAHVLTSWLSSLAKHCLFDLGTTLTKLSMLSLIYRLTAASASRMRHVVTIVAVIVAAGGLVFIIVTIFQCRYASRTFDFTLV
jgi:hypothetical protein